MVFTFRPDGAPTWYRGQPAFQSGNRFVSVLEEVRRVGAGTEVEPFGFLEMTFDDADRGRLKIYRVEDPPYLANGFEDLVYDRDFDHLAGSNGGATGRWRPTDGAPWGLVVTQLPTADDGSAEAFLSAYYFRPDGTPVWASTRSGERILRPFSWYSGG